MEFRILGPLEVVAEGRPLNLGGGKQRALLGILLLESRRVVPAERLLELVWAEDVPETARNVLQVHVFHSGVCWSQTETRRMSTQFWSARLLVTAYKWNPKRSTSSAFRACWLRTGGPPVTITQR